MSALNLLGRPGASDAARHGIAIWLVPLFAVIVVGVSHVWQARSLARMAHEVQTLRSDAAQISRQVAAVQRQARVNADMAARRGLVDKLGRHRGRALRVLHDLSDLLPSGIWLRDFEYSDGIVSLSGSAAEALLLANFLSRVEAVDAFTSFHVVDLKDDPSTRRCGFVAKGRLGGAVAADLPPQAVLPTPLDSIT